MQKVKLGNTGLLVSKLWQESAWIH